MMASRRQNRVAAHQKGIAELAPGTRREHTSPPFRHVYCTDAPGAEALNFTTDDTAEFEA
jgi:hypothetical protein